jgi:hypothetical protein
MPDGIVLRLHRPDLNVFKTIDEEGSRSVVHVAGREPAAICPSCRRPSFDTNGTGWRDVIDVVRTVVVTLSICVRRFVCEHEDCPQRTFDERFSGIGRSGRRRERCRSSRISPGGERRGLWRGISACLSTTCASQSPRSVLGPATQAHVPSGAISRSTSAR